MSTQVGGFAFQNHICVDAASHGQVCPETAPDPFKGKTFSFLHDQGTPHGDRNTIDSGLNVGACNGDSNFRQGGNGRPCKGHFQARFIFPIAHQAVAHPQGKWIHRAALSDPVLPEAKATQILKGG